MPLSSSDLAPDTTGARLLTEWLRQATSGNVAPWTRPVTSAAACAVTCGLCAACGTSLTYRNDARAAEIDVTLATLDDPTLLAPQMHLWVGDKLPWMSIDDGRPQFTAGIS